MDNKTELRAIVSIKDTEQFKVLLDIFTTIITDEEIPKQKREFYIKLLLGNL